MTSHTDRFRFGVDFNNVVHESHRNRRWYDMNWHAWFNVKTIYIFLAVSSFVLLFVYGALSIVVHDNCLVVESTGRCCQCLTAQETLPLAQRQVMPVARGYNDVYYGIVMMLGASFGVVYVYLGISQENRFIFFCMFATQSTEVLRGVLDLSLEPSEYAPRRVARIVVLSLAAVFMLSSWCLLRRMYKMFGWRIFRRGGAKRVVREMYKTYQRYRACNLLDVQASVLLFTVLVLFTRSARRDGFWVFIFVFLCELTASRYAVKYLKREDYTGVILSAVCKLIALIWWTITLAEYAMCWQRFQESRGLTRNWWIHAFFPKLDSVAAYYAGKECLPNQTAFDDRVVELLAINYALAVTFRLASLVIGVRVTRNFGKGMKSIFYVRPKPVAAGADGENLMDYTTGGYEDVLGEFSDDERTLGNHKASQKLSDQ